MGLHLPWLTMLCRAWTGTSNLYTSEVCWRTQRADFGMGTMASACCWNKGTPLQIFQRTKANWYPIHLLHSRITTLMASKPFLPWKKIAQVIFGLANLPQGHGNLMVKHWPIIPTSTRSKRKLLSFGTFTATERADCGLFSVQVMCTCSMALLLNPLKDLKNNI